MRFIKKLNEGLGDFPSLENQLQLDSTNDNKSIKNKALVQGNLVSDQIEAWDENKLTSNFKAELEKRILTNGWSKNDPFLNWLKETDDNNIKALNNQSAQHLIKLLDEDKLKNDSYILEDNNLFTGSSNDIIYKLNILSILLNPREADKFKNEKGDTPNIDIINVKGKFLDTNKIKEALDNFVTDDSDDSKDTIDFITWAHTKGKVQKGKEFAALRDRLKSQKGKWQDIAINALVDLRKLINNKDKNRLDALGKIQVKPNHDWGHIQLIMIKALNNKAYDVQKGIPLLIAFASQLQDFSVQNLETSPKLTLESFNKLLKDTYKEQANPYIEKLNKIFADDKLYSKFKNIIVPNNNISTILKYVVNFLNKEIPNEPNNKKTS